MLAIRVSELGGPEVLRFVETPDPPLPGPGEVLVRIVAAGVNPVETYVRSGAYTSLPALPYTPGDDGAGVVERVGDDVTGLQPGDRVYTAGSVTGTYAPLALATQASVHGLPPELSFAQGAALGVPYATAYRALFGRGAARPGERVLVHGATGGVGLAAVQFALAGGLAVAATGGTQKGRRLVLAQGVADVVDHSRPDHGDRLLDLTGGAGYDVILEMRAHANLGADLKLLARGGRVVVIGSRGEVQVDPRDLMQRDADVRGMLLFNAAPAQLAEAYAAIAAGAARGELRPVIARELPLSRAGVAHTVVSEGHPGGKIVLVP
jgi:NADPH2:quinone reductase